MAPTRLAPKPVNGHTEGMNGILAVKGILTRSHNHKTLKDSIKVVGKRKAGSPLRETGAKRAAFGDITNALSKTTLHDKDKNILVKKVVVEAKILPSLKVLKQKYQENLPPLVAKVTKTQNVTKPVAVKVKTSQKQPVLAASKRVSDKVLLLPNKNDPRTQKYAEKSNEVASKNSQKSDKSSGRLSEDFSEASLYVSALSDISIDSKVAYVTCKSLREGLLPTKENDDSINYPAVPAGVSDFDKDNWNDPFQVSHYAHEIFVYLKSREKDFKIDDYMSKQKNLTSWMRALLVDWMVEVQESFEMNHETLYLAVKLVDTYLGKTPTKKNELQLLGAASLFIAAKFDERIIPLVADFLYICDGAYSLRQLLAMEINVLKVIGFDLGIPLSYRFLRRYARCARVAMPVLTLARYILELCLMEYAMISISDSKMAAAALFLAIKMKKLGSWTDTHIHYTGYTFEEILPVVRVQNMCLHKTPSEDLSTVRNKYSHKTFFEVAKTPLLDTDTLKN